MEISFGESRIFCFPCFDMNGIRPNSLSWSGVSNTGVVPTEYQQGGTLKMGNEGWWKVWGIGASKFDQDADGIDSGTNVNIQIYDAMTSKAWFDLDGLNTERSTSINLGAPIEQVAGKWGNPMLLNSPRLLGPGHELTLKMAHYAATTPTGRSPYYVVLYCQLVRGPEDVEFPELRGLPSWIPQRFVFSSPHLDLNQSITKETQLDSPGDYLITGVNARCADFNFNDDFIRSLDPRYSENEILLSVRGSSMQNNFFQGQSIPICLVAGLFGARNMPMASFFRMKKGDSLITRITNQTLTDLESDIELTFTGLLEGARQ